MAAEAGTTVPAPHRSARDPISRSLVDTVLARALAAFALVFGAQALPQMLGQSAELQPVWAWTLGVAVYGGFLAVGVASVVRRGVETASGFVAVVYLVALVTWPLAVRDPAEVQPLTPWLWYVCTVATATAVFAWSTWVATIYTVVTPVVFAVVRTTPSGGDAGLGRAISDGAYAALLGGAVVVLVTMLRQAASTVDDAQDTAVARYTGAVREHATELERVQVDAIVHDSVLTTFIQAARAYTPEERELATTMARNAVAHLASAARSTPLDDGDVLLTELRDGLRAAIVDLGVEVDVTSHGIECHGVPSAAAEALTSAALQAVVNSAQHAGDGPDVRRSLRVSWREDVAVVEVVDTGRGFDPDTAAEGRLGVRVSIRERLARAGGRATVDSAPGRGTRILLEWPDPDGPEGPGGAPRGRDADDQEGEQR